MSDDDFTSLGGNSFEMMLRSMAKPENEERIGQLGARIWELIMQVEEAKRQTFLQSARAEAAEAEVERLKDELARRSA